MRIPSLLLLFFSLPLAAQQVPDPDDILVTGPRPQVLLVGSFHFAYYDLDAHVTDKDKRVNVMEPKRQREMEALVDHIARFKPTAIAVEAGPDTGWLMEHYRDHQRTDSLPRADEREQIGFRLMKRFGPPNVHLVSKAGPGVQNKTWHWLRHHDVYGQTGLAPSRVWFCLERHQKRGHCERLGITHFIDDRLDVLVHLRGVVPYLYLFGEQRRGQAAPSWVQPVSDWPAATARILGDLASTEPLGSSRR